MEDKIIRKNKTDYIDTTDVLIADVDTECADESEISELKLRNEQLTELANIMLSDIKKLYSSWSWKITYPIRAIINLFTIGQIDWALPGYLLDDNPYEKLLFGDEKKAEKELESLSIKDDGSAKEYKKRYEDLRKILSQYNPEPWNIPTEERTRRLIDDIHRGKKIVIHLYDIPDASTFRYTCYNVSQYMSNSETYGTHYFFQTEYRIVSRYLDDISLLVFCRTKWRNSYAELIRAAKEKGIKVVMQIDDLVCSMDYLDYILDINLDKKESDYVYDSWFANVSRLERIAREADAFIVTNDYLGEQIKNTFKKDYVVIRNSLNAEQISISQKILEIEGIKNTEKFIIGYYSGSPTHKKDLDVIIDDVKKLLDNYHNIVFLMVGYMDLPKSFKKYIKKGRVVVKRLVNFLELQYLIALADVNLVPLENNKFTNCKSELKFFEAAIAETVTVASPTFNYKNAISDRQDGFLCEPGEWYRTIEDIYAGKYDISDITKKAKDKVLVRFSGKAVTNEIEKAYTTLLGEN